MRLRDLFSGLIILTILSSCSVNKPIEANLLSGREAFQLKDYTSALSQLEEVISFSKAKNKVVGWDLYSMAGISALHTGNNDKARAYLEEIAYNENVDAHSIAALARVYLNIDNLSKELKTLELYLTKFPEGNESSEMTSRLFHLYIESENWEKGLATWEKLTQAEQEKTPHLEGFLKIHKALGNEELADKTAKKLFLSEKENILALNHLARKYYKRAEDLYQVEMKAYESNKTNRQYTILLDKLKIVSADFKQSRDYFERLYELDKKTEYVQFLGNIYARLNNKEKSEFYRNQAEDGR